MALTAKELVEKLDDSVQKLFTKANFDLENSEPEQVKEELEKYEETVKSNIGKARNLAQNGANASIKQQATRDLRQGQGLLTKIKQSEDIVTNALNSAMNKPNPTPEPGNALSDEQKRAEAEKKLYNEQAQAKKKVYDEKLKEIDFNIHHKSQPFMLGDTNLVNLFFIIVMDIANNDNLFTPASIKENIKKAYTDLEIAKNKRIDNLSTPSSTSEPPKDPAGLALDSFDQNPGVTLTPLDENNNPIGNGVSLEDFDTVYSADNPLSSRRIQLEIEGTTPENAALFASSLQNNLGNNATITASALPVPTPSRSIKPDDPALKAASTGITPTPAPSASVENDDELDNTQRLSLKLK